jgi:catechol 2,3-dioxygenase-like lactoylglutathione lyase family enzyme
MSLPARSLMKGAPAPRIFRILLPARNLAKSRRFYESLLSTRGRLVAGGRIYFDCGPVLLGILDYSSVPRAQITAPTEAVYFATSDLESVHRRARRLHGLASGLLHGDPSSPLGEVVVRPWGERSFYAEDPSGNSLCFVDARTLFTGTPRQVAALGEARGTPARSRGARSAPRSKSR